MLHRPSYYDTGSKTVRRFSPDFRATVEPATVVGMRGFLAICSLLLFGCSDDAGTASNTGAGGTSSGGALGTGSSAGNGGSSATGGSGGSGATGGSINVDSGMQKKAVKDLPGLESITFHERTGGTEPTPYTFTVLGLELTAKLPDPLTETSHDIPGADSEYYDVFYSNEDGSFNLEGSYLTISGTFEHALPAGGGLNLAEIGLDFTDSNTEYGNYVASYVVLGDNSVQADVANCIDSNLQTHTTMGNTVGQTDRLRLTLGFESTSGPPPR
jgi:hypothetical protein